MWFFYLAGTLLMIGGILLELRSMWFRKPEHPTCISANFTVISAVTFRPWKYKKYWDKPGYRYFIASRLFFLAALVSFAIHHFVN